MNNQEIDFLEEYKKICIKYGLEIRGFDDGAYISELNKNQLELKCLAYNIPNKGLYFREIKDFKNSIIGLDINIQNINI